MKWYVAPNLPKSPKRGKISFREILLEKYFQTENLLQTFAATENLSSANLPNLICVHISRVVSCAYDPKSHMIATGSTGHSKSTIKVK